MFGNFIPTFKYFWLTVKHKYFILKPGLRIGVPLLQLLRHDLSKFSSHELTQYGRQFYGDKSRPEEFDTAWLHHQNFNPHHWEYWIPRTIHDRSPSNSNNVPMEMPEKYAKEMAADWLGASRAYEGYYPESLEKWQWFQTNFSKLRLHPETRVLMLEILDDYFWEVTSLNINP